MNGFINLVTPAGMTSSDAVMCVKKLLPRKTAVGHGGTLDPDAAGVLPICVGKATRLFNYIIDKQKTYIGELALGVTTTTDDAGGEILSVREAVVSEDDIGKVLPRFIGDIEQVPPMYSALKRDGVALYKLARKGETVELESRTVHIESIRLLRKTGKEKLLIAANISENEREFDNTQGVSDLIFGENISACPEKIRLKPYGYAVIE